MNIKNLEVGMVIKNYKELCKLLGEKEKAGNSRKAQLNDWTCYFKYHKEGHKFVIDEIYEQPLISLKTGKNNIYGELIQLLIIDMLLQNNQTSTSMVLSKGSLYTKIGLVNQNYVVGKYHKNKLSNHLGIDKGIVLDFYRTHGNSLDKNVKRALNNLQDQRLIMFNMVHKVKLKDSNIVRMAKDYEKEQILKAEHLVLNKLGYKAVSDIRRSNDWDKFKRQTKELIQEISDIEYYYLAYEMSVLLEYLPQAKALLIEKISNHEDRELLKNELNTLVKQRMLINTQRTIDNTKITDKYGMLRHDCSYLDGVKTMIDVLISRHAYDRTNHILKANDGCVCEIDINEQLPF